MKKIWIIGGTVETYQISQILLDKNIDIIISVATDYGYEEFYRFKDFLVKGKMDKQDMTDFCKKNEIIAIADVSHPYAKDVSKNAMQVSHDLKINYYRYERPQSRDIYKNDDIYYVDNHKEAIDLIKKLNFKRVFLTTGINNVDYYINAHFDELFIRILARSEQIKYLEEKGYKSKNIIAMQGPFSKDMNVSTIKHINADVIITKQSGKQGGYDEKISACIETGISAIIIKRPELEYINKFDNINNMIEKIIFGVDKI